MAAGTGAALSVIFLVGGVVVMLVLHILIVIWALRRGLSLRRAPPLDEECAAAKGLSAEELRSLPCHDHECKDGGAVAGECAVCLEAFQAGERCRVLPGCEHGFHAQCVDSWLRKSRVCPICRAEVVVVVVSCGKAAGAVASEVAAAEVVAQRQGGADR